MLGTHAHISSWHITKHRKMLTHFQNIASESNNDYQKLDILKYAFGPALLTNETFFLQRIYCFQLTVND